MSRSLSNDHQPRQFEYQDFEECNYQNIIGRGGFGNVHKVKELATGKYYAIKVIIPPQGENIDENFFKEIRIIQKFRYPTILSLYGIINDFPYSIITEYMPNKSVFSFIHDAYRGISSPNWDITKKIIILFGICFGMRYLHSLSISHRDLKPENILLDNNFYPRICDFGLSKETYESLSSNVGTPAYQAPEVQNSSYDGKKADVFSFGMTMYSILYDSIPFVDTQNPISIFQKILNGERPQLENNVIPKAVNNLIQSCWQAEPQKRPDFDYILNDLIKIIKIKEKESALFHDLDQQQIEVFFRFCNEISFLELWRNSNQQNSQNQKIQSPRKEMENKSNESPRRGGITFNPISIDTLTPEQRAFVMRLTSGISSFI